MAKLHLLATASSKIVELADESPCPPALQASKNATDPAGCRTDRRRRRTSDKVSVLSGRSPRAWWKKAKKPEAHRHRKNRTATRASCLFGGERGEGGGGGLRDAYVILRDIERFNHNKSPVLIYLYLKPFPTLH